MIIEQHGYSVEINPDGRFSISHNNFGKLKNIGIQYETAETGTITHRELHVESILEGESQAEIHFKHGDDKIKIGFQIKPEGILIKQAISHKGQVAFLYPLVCDEYSDITGGKNIHNIKYFQPGYQSWSPSGSRALLDKEPFPKLRLLEQGGFHPTIGFKPAAGAHHADWATVISNTSNGECFLVGFTTAVKFLPFLRLEVRSDPQGAEDKLTIYAGCDIERISSREEWLESETLFVSIGDDPHLLWEQYLELAGKSMRARIKDRAPSGWCSWYHYFALITEKALRANLEEMRKRRDDIGVEVFQLDDGYCVVGDWLEWNEKFPSGGLKLAGDIAQAGFIPGIWVAPFICARGSRLFREHPDWLLKNDKGKPLLVGINPWWKGKAFYALDLTNPSALGYVERVMKQIKEWGYNFVKIDFVYAALLPGKRYDSSKTGLQAYREGLRIIRESLGDDVFLLGCGAPLLPSVGMVDGMRVSADVAQYWKSRLTRLIAGAPFDPSAENAVHGTICRSAMHKRWWLNDPDCLLVRKTKSLLTIDEIHTLATVIFLSGGQLLISDDMTALDADRWEIIRACIPQLGKAAKPLDLFTNENPCYYYLPLPEKKRALLAIVNWQNKPQSFVVDPVMLKLSKPHYVFEFWRQKYVGIVENSPLPLPFSIPKHGCALLSLTPVTGTPKVVGTSLHLGMGAMELTSEEVHDNMIRISLALPGPRKGRVWFIVPGKPSHQALISREIAFMDKIEFDMKLE